MSDDARPVTHYHSKSHGGPIPIATMPYPHLLRTRDKLQREGGEAATVAAMDARLAELDALPDDAARIAATTPPLPAMIGHNAPPPAQPLTFEQIKSKIEDLYGEAKNWLDGQPITTQAQADEVSRLKGMMKEAAAEADALRIKENEPFDAGKREVQGRYAPLIADIKSAPKGLTVRAVAACEVALTPWLKKLDDEHQEALREAQRIADAAIETVQVVAAIADMGRLDDAEEVNDAVVDAKAAIRTVTTLEKDRARVGGGEYRATLLRDNFVATLTDGDAALAHYWKMRRGDVEAFLAELASKEVKETKGRPIPGFHVENVKRAA